MIDFPYSQSSRPATGTTRADVARQHGITPVYGLAYNESPLGPSPTVVAAIQKAAVGIGDYPTMGDEALREALAATWGRGMTAGHFFSGCSGYEALELTARAFLQPGDEVLVAPPTFGAYTRIAEAQGAQVRPVPLIQPAFVPDVDALLRSVTRHTRLIILCNPNNPTGTILPVEEMDRLVRQLPDHVLLVADEVYHHFVTAADYPDSLKYVLEGRPLILIQSFSKAYGLAGLRLGYAIAPPEIANYVGGFHRAFHQNRLALAAGLAALEDQAHVQRNVQLVLEGRQWLYDQLARLGLSYIPSQTNFVVVHLPRDPQEVVNELLAFGVMVQPLKGEGLDGCLRVSVSLPEANRQFIRGLEGAL